MLKSYLLPIYLCLLSASHAQHQLSGYIYNQENNIQSPLAGASVYWENSTSGTVSNDDGYFTLVHNQENTVLVVSYLGFKTIKLTSGFNKPIEVILIPDDAASLNEVTVLQRRKALQRAVFTLET
jgi:hypothetical protein